MIALILKDIATLKKTLLLTIAICIALAAYGIYENTIFMIPLICAMIPLILTAIAFGFDTKSKFEQFAFSMPVKKSNYVLSKLFFSFVFGIIGSICSFVLQAVQNKMSMYNIILISLYYIGSKCSDVSYSTSFSPQIWCGKRQIDYGNKLCSYIFVIIRAS